MVITGPSSQWLMMMTDSGTMLIFNVSWQLVAGSMVVRHSTDLARQKGCFCLAFGCSTKYYSLFSYKCLGFQEKFSFWCQYKKIFVYYFLKFLGFPNKFGFQDGYHHMATDMQPSHKIIQQQKLKIAKFLSTLTEMQQRQKEKWVLLINYLIRLQSTCSVWMFCHEGRLNHQPGGGVAAGGEIHSRVDWRRSASKCTPD